MKKTIYLIFLINLIFFGCKPKEKLVENVSCDGKLKSQYEWLDWNKEDRTHVVANRFFKGGFTIYFVSELKDSLKLYVNSEFRAKLDIDRSENEEELNYAFSFGKAEDSIPTVKVESESKKTCFDVKLNRKYPIVYVWLDKNGEWTIRFSNFIHSDNLKKASL